MRKFAILLCTLILSCAVPALAAPKVHTVTLGKPTLVKLFLGGADTKSIDLKIRPLYVDGKLKEFATGDIHEVTEHLFVIQRAYRVNDSLPDDARGPRWKWQRGGWLLVDRTNGHISKLTLPDFDPYYSSTTWYREFAAYCGTSSDGEKLFAVVAQIGIRKPIVHQLLGPTASGDLPDSECAPPEWQKQPTRVTFLPKRGPKVAFEIHGRAVDVAPGDDAE